jgi:tRNA dimethylallyltransferase
VAEPSLADDPLEREPLCALVGPTACGKTALSLEACERAGAEVLSMDSMLVYRGLDIGTAKPTAAERARVPHHLLDLVEVGEVFDASRWLAAARDAVDDCLARGRRALFVGGTGFYLAALLRGLFEGPPPDPAIRGPLEQRAAEDPGGLHGELARVDPASAARLHANDTRRVVRALEVLEQTGRTLSSWQEQWAAPAARAQRARLVGLEVPVAELDARIRTRAGVMLDQGWQEEAERARVEGLARGAAQALGYAEVLDLADGVLSRSDALEAIALRTRQFARRQRTWYRKFAIEWLPAAAPDRLERALAHWGWGAEPAGGARHGS